MQETSGSGQGQNMSQPHRLSPLTKIAIGLLLFWTLSIAAFNSAEARSSALELTGLGLIATPLWAAIALVFALSGISNQHQNNRLTIATVYLSSFALAFSLSFIVTYEL